MRQPSKSWAQRAQKFWEQRQRLAKPGALTGYLQDESPACIGQRRFEGEWAAVQGLLAGHDLRRARCLDVGCGTGLWLKAFAGQFAHVEGWDYAPAMIKASRQTLAGVRNAKLHVGQVTRRPGRAVFDVIFVGGVLMYTPDEALGPLLKALRRLLKPNGLLILRESTFKGPTWSRVGEPLQPGFLATPAQLAGQDYVAIYRSAEALAEAASTAGFQLLALRPNSSYKLSDLTEAWLRRLDPVLGLRGKAARAEKTARWVYRLRYLLLYPEYFVRRWKLANHWFLLTSSKRKAL